MVAENGSEKLGIALSDEAIVRRYARKFPGYRLANYGQVALPLFRMRVRVLKITRKKIPVVQQFVLRSIDAGLTHAADIAGFLGLERAPVNAALSDLATSEDIILGGTEGDRAHRLVITEQGRGTLNTLTLETMEEDIEVVHFDGLTRSLVIETEQQFISPQEVRKQGLTELSPYPRAKPEIEDFREQLFQDWKQKNPDFDLIALLRIERVQAVFRDDVLLLTYRNDAEAEDTAHTTQMGFVIGGHWSEAHAEAFQKSNSDSRIPLETELPVAEATAAIMLEPALSVLVAPIEETAVLRDQISSAGERIRTLEAQLKATTSASQTRTLQEQLRHEQSRRSEAEAGLLSIPVRQIEAYEHPPIFAEALSSASERLMVISPWVCSSSVNSWFLDRIEKALKRGVSVYLGYGTGNGNRFDQDAIQKLKNLRLKYEHLYLQDVGDTNAKILLCDSRFVVITSFNWLSYGGDPRRSFRDERGYYVSTESQIEKMFSLYESRF